jgi:hypothetical protein
MECHSEPGFRVSTDCCEQRAAKQKLPEAKLNRQMQIDDDRIQWRRH